MAFRIHESVIRGEIDNRVRGRITGSLWLHGRKNPVLLDLEGDAHRDLAGCLLQFSATTPTVRLSGRLAAKQKGLAGDFTASRKVKVPSCGSDEFRELVREGKEFPWRWANCLYLEWFSDLDGRVVLESAEFKCTVSEPAWTMTAGEESRQLRCNEEAMRDWFEEISSTAQKSSAAMSTDIPLNEFQWEQLLRESDLRADAWMEVFEKYHDHPEAEKKISETLGFEEGEEEDAEDLADLPEVEVSWEALDAKEERDEHEHPLCARASDLALRLHRESEIRDELHPASLQILVGSVMTLAAKLAGALGSIHDGSEPDHGFVVACLKRALEPLHQSLQGCQDLRRQKAGVSVWLNPVQAELFDLRTEILELMREYRGQI